MTALLTIAITIAGKSMAVDIIVNNSVQSANSNIRKNIKSIFLLRKTNWEDGSQIRVFVLPDTNPLHSDFAAQILGLFPYQIENAWSKEKFRGSASINPVVVNSEYEMLSAVARTPGSIGYLNSTTNHLKQYIRRVVHD